MKRSPSTAAISVLGTQTHDQANDGEVEDVVRTKILLLGMRKSGKTSIRHVLFDGMTAKQTFFIEHTARITKRAYDTVIPLEIWDCPASTTPETLGVPLSHFSSLIFVVDVQALLQKAIEHLTQFVIAAYEDESGVVPNFEVFAHKAEALSDDYKLDHFRQIQQRVFEELIDTSQDYEQVPINFHLTSVYDHSLHEAFSKVLQNKLIDSLPNLEDLLNVFTAKSQSSKTFLFDVNSRLYVATDESPVDSTIYALCCDFLQTLTSFGPLYKSISASPTRHCATISSSTTGSASNLGTPLLSPKTPLQESLSASTTALRSPSPPLSTHSSMVPSPHPMATAPKSRSLFYPSACTTLAPSTTLTYHLVTPKLALLMLLPSSLFERRRGLVEYNVVFFREGVHEICAAEWEARSTGGASSGSDPHTPASPAG